MRRKAKILGTGSYVPKKILSNLDLEKMVDTSDEWIVTRTGIRERRIAAEDEYTSDLGVKAAQAAIADSSLSAEEIDCILVSTITPDYSFPSTACIIQHRLGIKNVPALDIQAACSGYLYALSIAKSFVETGVYKNILIVAADKISSIVNYKDRSTCVVFGDGASASVVGYQGKGLLIRDVVLGADGEQAELLSLPAGGSRRPACKESVENGLHYLHMSGNAVFKHAVRRMEMAIKECLDRLEMKESQINWFVPHQANERIIDTIAKRFEDLPPEKIYKKALYKYGNTSAASIGIALDEIRRENTLNAGENILMTAFGSGLTWGATVLTQEKMED